MARFVLTPCKLRAEKAVPLEGQAPLCLNWVELTNLLAPSRTRNALATLRRLRVHSYVGLETQAEGAPTNFLFMNDNRSNNMESLLKRKPSLSTQLQALYRVDAAELDSRVEEISSGIPE
jgi:hypothetical protein